MSDENKIIIPDSIRDKQDAENRALRERVVKMLLETFVGSDIGDVLDSTQRVVTYIQTGVR